MSNTDYYLAHDGLLAALGLFGSPTVLTGDLGREKTIYSDSDYVWKQAFTLAGVDYAAYVKARGTVLETKMLERAANSALNLAGGPRGLVRTLHKDRKTWCVRAAINADVVEEFAQWAGLVAPETVWDMPGVDAEDARGMALWLLVADYLCELFGYGSFAGTIVHQLAALIGEKGWAELFPLAEVECPF